MHRTRFSTALMVLGTAAALVLPASGALANPGRGGGPPAHAPAYGRRDQSRPGYDRRDNDRYGRYDDRRHGDRDRYERDRRDRDRRDRDRYDNRRSKGSNGNNDLLVLIGGVILGSVLSGSR